MDFVDILGPISRGVCLVIACCAWLPVVMILYAQRGVRRVLKTQERIHDH